MFVSRHFVVLALLLSLATTGCNWFKRKKQPAVVPQAQAPTVATKPAEPPSATETAPQPAPAEEQKPAHTATVKPKPKPRPPAKKIVVPPPKPAEQASAAPPPRVAIQESAPPPSSSQISALPHDQASDAKRSTQQLLDSTDANLRNLTRALSAEEKAIVEQIRAYQQQARTAGQQGDVVRAHNLALKAHLLSDELVKR